MLRTGNSADNQLTLVLENILITANNGSDAPVSLDGLTLEDMTGAIPINDDGIFLAGDDLVATFTDVVVTHARGGIQANADGLVVSSAIESILIGDGCVFSFNNRLGIQATAAESFVVDAPNDRVLVLGNDGFAGVWFSTAQTVERSINGMNIIGNDGFGIEHQNRGAVDATFSNMIIANNGNHGFVVGSVGTGGAIVSDVTIANNGGEAINVVATSAGDFTFTDSVVGGAAGVGSIVNDGTGTVTLNNSAVVLAGAYRLAGSGITGSGAVVQNDVINSNPNFTQVSDFTLDTFYQVTSPDYEEAATGGAELKGGGTYELVLPTTSTERNWNLYR